MPVNDHQIGGTHYSILPYQHWDWVADAGLTYLQGQATKYLARYPQTKSLEDLRKAQHYREKIKETVALRSSATRRFVRQFESEHLQNAILEIASISSGDCDAIEYLIAAHSAAPVPLTEETHHGERTEAPEDWPPERYSGGSCCG